MGVRNGPIIDRMLMRGKDIATLVTLVGMAWALFKGVDQVIERFKNLETTILSQNISIAIVTKQQQETLNKLDQLQHPNWRRMKRTDEE